MIPSNGTRWKLKYSQLQPYLPAITFDNSSTCFVTIHDGNKYQITPIYDATSCDPPTLGVSIPITELFAAVDETYIANDDKHDDTITMIQNHRNYSLKDSMFPDILKEFSMFSRILPF